jgi:hypothetical protein
LVGPHRQARIRFFDVDLSSSSSPSSLGVGEAQSLALSDLRWEVEVTEQQRRFSRGRRLGVRILAMLGLLLFMLFVGMVAAAAVGIVEEASQASPRDPPPSAAARFGASHPDEAVHVSGALGVLLIGGSGLVGLILRPERPGYSYQVLAAMLGALLTLPVVGNPDNYGGQAGWIDPVLLVFILPPMLAAAVAFPWRRWGSGHGWRPSHCCWLSSQRFPLHGTGWNRRSSSGTPSPRRPIRITTRTGGSWGCSPS